MMTVEFITALFYEVDEQLHRHCQLIDQRSHLMRYSLPTMPPPMTNHTPG
jgi:hypothetical protein